MNAVTKSINSNSDRLQRCSPKSQMGVHELEDRIKKRMDYRNCVLITRFFFATNLPFPERSSSARTPRGLLEPARIPERHSNSTLAGIKISMEVLPASQNNHAWKDERIERAAAQREHQDGCNDPSVPCSSWRCLPSLSHGWAGFGWRSKSSTPLPLAS
jgi:hypothetical protein